MTEVEIPHPSRSWAIDTHCHLDHADFAPDLSAVIERAIQSNVHYLIVPGSDHASSLAAADLSDDSSGIWAAIGLHPHQADAHARQLPLLEEALTQRRYVAIGECGLDFHYHYSTPQNQQAAFVAQLALAESFNLPLIVHVRQAWAEIRHLIEDHYRGNKQLIFHAFSGDEDDANWIMGRGNFIGLGGAITFAKAEGLREIAKDLPVDRVLLETDAPYLTPAPHRGHRNEPAYVSLIAAKLAELRNLPLEEVRAQTSLNARQVLGLPRRGSGDVVYRLGNNLYLNLTNRCPNDCAFCLRHRHDGVAGAKLWLDLEPTVAEVLNELDSIIPMVKPCEVVFCGFGEPTSRWQDVLAIAQTLKSRGIKTRLNTNGLGNLLLGRDIIPEVDRGFNSISISLNAPDAITYDRICQPGYPHAFEAVVDFIKRCSNRGITTCLSCIGDILSGEELDGVRHLATELKVEFRVRHRV